MCKIVYVILCTLKEDYNRMKNVLKEIILMFLKLEEEETDCPFAFWNKVPELINDRGKFLFYALTTWFATFVS